MTAERQAFPARKEALAEVSAFIERRCRELRLGRQPSLKLLLMAEELFINAVLHGYGGDCDQQVVLTVRDRGQEIELLAEDSAVPFNPFVRLPSAEPSPERPPGGFGRLLVAGLSSRHAYERRGHRNRVSVSVQRTAAAPA